MKIVRENISEKFSEDSDPIVDMGIGSKWRRVKKGDILISKTKRDISLEDSRFFDSGGTYQTHIITSRLNNSIIVSSNYDADIISLKLIIIGDIRYALRIQNRIGDNSFLEEGWIFTLLSAPIKLWDKYFDIYKENN